MSPGEPPCVVMSVGIVGKRHIEVEQALAREDKRRNVHARCGEQRNDDYQMRLPQETTRAGLTTVQRRWR